MKILFFAVFLALGSGQDVPNTNSVTNINNINNVGSGGVNAVNANNDVNNINSNNRNLNPGNQNMNQNPSIQMMNNNVDNGGRNMGDQPFLPEYPAGSDRIYRPCPDMNKDCIRKYFEKHGKCKAVYEPAPDPVIFKHVTLYLSNFNITDDQYGIELRGLNGEIREFYVNELTDLVVLQVQFTNVRVNNSLDVFRYHRPGKVDAITKSNSRAIYPSFATTTVFRGVKHLDLKRAESNSYLDVLPTLFVNPSAGDHPDPGVRRTFAEFVARPRVVSQEVLLTTAPLVATNYVQYTICDYGLKIV